MLTEDWPEPCPLCLPLNKCVQCVSWKRRNPRVLFFTEVCDAISLSVKGCSFGISSCVTATWQTWMLSLSLESLQSCLGCDPFMFVPTSQRCLAQHLISKGRIVMALIPDIGVGRYVVVEAYVCPVTLINFHKATWLQITEILKEVISKWSPTMLKFIWSATCWK